MRYQRLDLNLLVILDALLSECSVSRAADRLSLSQSAVSGSLARLREHFEDELLVPTGRAMRLTPRGNGLRTPVRHVLEQIELIRDNRSQFDPSVARREFVIVASDYVSRVLLDDVLGTLANIAPNLTFVIRPTIGDAEKSLEDGHVDLLVTPAHRKIARHPHELLFEDTYTVIVATNHPTVVGHISLDQYQSLGHVIYQNDEGVSPWFEQWYAHQYGAGRRIEVVTHGFTLLPALVANSRRVATLQSRLASRLRRDTGVQLLAPPMVVPRFAELLQWRSGRDGDAGLCWLRDHIVNAARALPPIASGERAMPSHGGGM